MDKSAEKNFESLKQQVMTLHLSTINNEGKPQASYAPFVTDDAGNFYIFISGLAKHTQDLLSTPYVSILLMQDEQDARQIYARRRISYQCNVEVVSSETSEHNETLNKMGHRFGNIVELLRNLSDFVLFRLQPYQGQFVMGFGQAYDLRGEGLLELSHIDPSNIADSRQDD